MKLPAYQNVKPIENQENSSSRVFYMRNADEEALLFYESFLLREGFEKKEERRGESRLFEAYSKGNDGVFLNYFDACKELYIVEEKNTLYFSRYFSFNDTPSNAVSVAPQITQVMLEDYGMSYVIRLSDGSFIVMDGGRDLYPDVESLYSCLKAETPHDKPRIACWIMTHPHSDHFYSFMPFMDRHGEDVEIDSFLLNFPDANDLLHYPLLAKDDPRFEDSAPSKHIPQMYERIEKTGAVVHTAHTGKLYAFSGAELEILSCMDDTIHLSQKLNAISLVIRMEIAGQVVLWGTDAYFSVSKLGEKYGSYLKADILQIPHHGFQAGEPEPQILAYDLIRPEVALLPASDFNVYTAFCIHKEATSHLLKSSYLGELITGDTQRTITLPYRASENGKRIIAEKCKKGIESCGAHTFVFSGLNTAKATDLEFSFLNMTHSIANVMIELFFENSERNVRAIKLQVASLSLLSTSIVGEKVEPNALYFNPMSLDKCGIPNDSAFAVRFISDIPIVVSHKEHTAIYHS